MIWGIVGLKGGTGKTTTTNNFACALAKKGLKVGVIDLDIPFSNVANAFKKNIIKTWKHWRPGMSAESVMTKVRENIYLMGCSLTFVNQPEAPSIEHVHEFIITASHEFDVCLVDCGSHWNEYVDLACKLATKILIISSPDQVGIQNGIGFLNMAKPSVPVEWILNRVQGEVPFSEKDIEGLTGKPVAFTLAEEKEVMKCLWNGETLLEKRPNSAWSKTFLNYVSKEISLTSVSTKKKKKSWLFRIFSLGRR